MKPRPRGIVVYEDGTVEHGWTSSPTSFTGELPEDCMSQEAYMLLESVGEEFANWSPEYRLWFRKWRERHDPQGVVRDEELPPL